MDGNRALLHRQAECGRQENQDQQPTQDRDREVEPRLARFDEEFAYERQINVRMGAGFFSVVLVMRSGVILVVHARTWLLAIQAHVQVRARHPAKE